MEISEVDNLRDNISWLRSKMPKVVNNWQSTRPNCNYNFGIVKEVCLKPGLMVSKIFDPLIKWLFDYELNREGKLAFPGTAAAQNFYRLGLRLVYNFILISDFLSQNPQYYTPSAPVSNLPAYKETRKSQKEFSDFVDLLSSKMIGCNEQMSFLFLKLSKSVPNLTDDLKRMQEYLSNYCTSLRIKELKK